MAEELAAVMVQEPQEVDVETSIPVEEENELKTGTESFVYMEDTVRAIDTAFSTKQNLILYGKGGYGKSEFSIEHLREMGIEPFVQTMGTGMTTDRLFGGFDLKTFNESGKMEYLVENSFMNQKFVLFEELFDAPDFILEQLKDILSAGVFRNGSQTFPIKTKIIICCTNKTRKEFAETNSLKALMERFPLEHKVEWVEHTRVQYANLFTTKLGHSDSLLTFILESYHSAGHTISPRIALAAARVISRCGVEHLQFIADFAAEPLILQNCLVKFEGVLKLEKLGHEVSGIAAKLQAVFEKDAMAITAAEVRQAKEDMARLGRLHEEVEGLLLDDSSIAAKADLLKKIKSTVEDSQSSIELFF